MQYRFELIVCVLVMAITLESLRSQARIVVRQSDDLETVFSMKNSEYVIKDKVNLFGKTIRVGEGCVIIFKGGSLCNGTVVGNDTRINKTKKNVFHDCTVLGKWNVSCSYSSMFNDSMKAITLLKNLAVLSPHIRLYANRSYIIEPNSEVINVASISSADKNKPIISFHTKDPNATGIVLSGNSIVIKGMQFTDDYDVKKDIIFGQNDITIGSMILVQSPDKIVKSLVIQDCTFSGGTSSSFVSSSQTRNCLIDGCTFSGDIGDHAVYCSTKVNSFVVQNCQVQNISHTRGVFKVRSSSDLALFSIKETKARNLNGYLAVVSLVETPNCELLFDRITVTKDSNNDSVFYGFCIGDETQAMFNERYNADHITVRNCSFGYGYDGSPVLYQGAGKAAHIKSIYFYNTSSRFSSFGGFADILDVDDCSFEDGYGKYGMALHARHITIKNSKISGRNKEKRDCLFLINYYNEPVETLFLSNVEISTNVNNLVKVVKGDSLSVSISNSLITSPISHLFFTPTDCRIDYHLDANNIARTNSFRVFGRRQ